MRRAAWLFVGAIVAAASPAGAESRAWMAAKKVFPSGLQAIGGGSLGAIRDSSLYGPILPAMLAQAGEVKVALDKLKDACKLDLLAKLDSFALGVDATQQVVVVAALDGLVERELDACVRKAAPTVTITTDQHATKYAGFGDKDLYVRWLAKDVVAFTSAPHDAAVLAALTAGGIDKDKLPSVKTAAMMWAVVVKDQDVPGIAARMKLGYGSIDSSAGTLRFDVHLALDDAKVAAATATQATQQIAAAKQAGQVPAQLASILDSIRIKSSGRELVMSGAMAEKDVLPLLAAMTGH